jgi:mersacidin/lichenicidin family type 2 lantibiotic
MTLSDIIRAWKDPRYRAGLPATQRAQLPAHPAGAIELPEPTLHAAWPH